MHKEEREHEGGPVENIADLYVGRGELNELRVDQFSIDNGGSIRAVPMVWPALEPPPRGGGSGLLDPPMVHVVILLKKMSFGVYFIVFLRFYFYGQTVMFCFYAFLCCKTLALNLGDERPT
ncbi:unnamed protein product [Cuscuta epithymum]|uniref:Uncharacterized protein n=1 Tax=Cuscuta epithymum TaxID=186058 RepID=A0AAV0E842_9ASTE|nr:unnamed protein product [Cuscuta epithymum]